MSTQTKKLFFDPTPNRLYPNLPSRPSDEKIRVQLGSNNNKCPLSKIIVSDKNRGNMRVLKRFAFNAFTDPFHSCKGMSFGIYAGPGQGKTYVVKQWIATIGIPYLFIQSDTLESTYMLFDQIMEMFIEADTPLESQDNDYHFALPPCIIFFDEAHALKRDLRTGGLLNAMEANDGWLRTSPPGRNKRQYEIDCSEVCWIAASTDPGILLKQSAAFYERLRMHIQWHPAGREEIAQIVKLDNNRKISEEPEKYVEIPDEACEIVANYETVPRAAIAFADQMILERRMMDCSWEEAAATVADDIGIDKFGIPRKIITILKALANNGPISNANILNVIGCRREQFDSQYAPVLMANLDGTGPLARTTSKGWAITETGCGELTKRGVPHKGEKFLASHYM